MVYLKTNNGTINSSTFDETFYTHVQSKSLNVSYGFRKTKHAIYIGESRKKIVVEVVYDPKIRRLTLAAPGEKAKQHATKIRPQALKGEVITLVLAEDNLKLQARLS